MSNIFSQTVKRKFLHQYFQKELEEFSYSYALMKAGILARLLFICDIPGDIPVSESITNPIQIPLLQTEREIDRIARTEICIALKQVGIKVNTSSATGCVAAFNIDFATVTDERIKNFQNL